MVPWEPRQKSSRDFISMEKKPGMVVHACHPSYSKKCYRRIMVRWQKVTKITRAKRDGSVTQV
jgi:hypothetical protein